MTIPNDLDSNLSLLSRISSDGRNQSNELNVLLTTTSQTCFVREDFSVPLREFMETFLSYHPATQFPPVEHHTSKHDSLYLEDVGVAADWFKINIDHCPENIDEKFKSDQFIITTTFMVTTMLPIELAELRLIVLNSPIFEKFSRPMQSLLKLQLISSYLSIGELSNAKTFLNRFSKSNKFSSIPEFKTLQDSIFNVKLESPDPALSPERNNTREATVPAIVDDFVDQNQDEEDIIDTKPDLNQIQNHTQSSRKQYDISDDEKPALNTRSNSLADQDPIVIMEEETSDTKPNLDQIRQPKRSTRKRRGTSSNNEPLINTASDRISNQNEVLIIDEDLSDSKPLKKKGKPSKQSSKKRQVVSNEDEFVDEDLSDSKPLRTKSQRSTRSSKKQQASSDEDESIDEELSDSKPLPKKSKCSKRSSKKRGASSDEDESLLGTISTINANRPKLDDIISRMAELIEELEKTKGVSKQECIKMYETLDDRRKQIRSVKYIDRKIPKSDQHMRTYEMYRNWCAKNKFSELPITFDKAFLWAELCLRSYSVHHLKMMRRIRELNWFRGETICKGSDDISFWPDSFWNEYFEDERFPIVFTTKGGDPRRVAYPRKNINQMNKYPAPMPPQRKRPKASSSTPSTSLSPPKPPKSESRSVSCKADPEVAVLDDEPSPGPIDLNIAIDADLESCQDMEEAKYVISTNHTWSEPINKIDFDSLRKPKHIHKNKIAIIDQLRWESEGVIIEPKLFADAFWKCKTDGITPLQNFGKREESIRTLDKYLQYCEQHLIMAFPVTKMKVYLFFMEDLHHLAFSTTRNYARYLFHAVKLIKIMIPHLAGESITIEELRVSKLWSKWIEEREEHDRLRKSGNLSH